MSIIRLRGINFVHVVILALGTVMLAAYIGDAIHATKVRRDVMRGMVKAADQAKRQAAGATVAGRETSEELSGFCAEMARVDINLRNRLITLTFYEGEEIAGKTLVLLPLVGGKNGEHLLLSDEEWLGPVRWVCTSSMSKMRYAPELLRMRGTLPSWLAPAECRY